MNTEATTAPHTILTGDYAFIHRVWPWAVVAMALLVNCAWMALLGYGLFKTIMFVF